MAASDDFKSAAQRMEEIAKRLKNLKPVLTVAAEDLRKFVDNRFESSSAPDGEEWQDLSPTTIMRRAQRGKRRGKNGRRRKLSTQALHNAIGNVKPLVDTGRLRQSITTRVDNGSVYVGTNTAYAAVHQWGGAEIPARPFLPFVKAGENQYTIDMSGPAGALWTDIIAMVREYIATGQIR